MQLRDQGKARQGNFGGLGGWGNGCGLRLVNGLAWVTIRVGVRVMLTVMHNVGVIVRFGVGL